MSRTMATRLRFAAVLLASIWAVPALPASRAETEAQFQKWLANDLWAEASARGISRSTFDQAFNGVRLNWELPDLVPPGTKPKTPKKQVQAEFGSPGSYFSSKTISALTSGGRARAGQYASTLKAIEKQYGVPGQVLLAIWGRESGFGGVKIPHNAFQVLGTKAFMATRKDMFRKELVAALEIVEKGYIDAGVMKSSWAGAMGQPQFMPTSYLKHAVDFDGDGHRDIWKSVPDTLASIANYLKHYNWQTGRDWGFEVNAPESLSCSLEGPDQGLKISDWARLGVTRVNGKPFPANELKGEGYLLMPAGRHGPAFVVTPNFYAIKSYNESDLYSLFIGHVGDRIAHGAGNFSQPWGAVGGMYRSDVATMQKALEAQGYDVGGADGLPGFKTRRSIGDWQSKQGMQPTCFPEKSLIGAIR
ncbi:MAG: lytic murein transglycosylase [Phyllobacterium sp.]